MTARRFEDAPAVHKVVIDLSGLPPLGYAADMAIIRFIMGRAIPADYATVLLRRGRQFGWAPRRVRFEEEEQEAAEVAARKKEELCGAAKV